MSKTLFIPETIKVGFQKREGTYNGELSYVVYYEKGMLKKEKSWQSWRDKKIDPRDFPNEPTEGFVLNKKAGGGYGGWNKRNEWIRIYDPRGFELEISVANLLLILENCDCSRGKGLEGKFVYSWNAGELVLLPVNSVDYKESSEFTENKDKTVNKKDLKIGYMYKTKKMENCVYLGFLYRNRIAWSQPTGNFFTFYDVDNKKYIHLKDASKLAICCSDQTIEGYQDLISEYMNSRYFKKPVRLKIKSVNKKDLKSFLFSHLVNDCYHAAYNKNNLEEYVKSEDFEDQYLERMSKEVACEARVINNSLYMLICTRSIKDKMDLDIYEVTLAENNFYPIGTTMFRPSRPDYFGVRKMEKNEPELLKIKEEIEKEGVFTKCSCVFVEYEDGTEESVFSVHERPEEKAALKIAFSHYKALKK